MDKPPHSLTRSVAKAGKLLKDPSRALALARRAGVKLDGNAGRLEQVRTELTTMVAMLRAWASGAYTGVSRTALLSIAAGIVYFVSPLDAIPDFLLGFGLLDDVAVIGFIVQQVRAELAAFSAWQVQQQQHQPAVDDHDNSGS